MLGELAPKGFLFENVYGIIGAQGGEAWKEILQAFSEAGYKLFYRVIDAADYGVPQHRERLMIVGLKEGMFKFPRPTHGPDSLDDEAFYNAGMALQGVKSKETDQSNKLGGRYAHLLDNIPPGLNYSFYTDKMGHPNAVFAWRSKFSDFLYKADPDKPVRTIKASGGAYTGPLHWDNRFFKLEEYKRLQTFPDDYEISGSKQVAVKQIGNSVPPQLARIMAVAIRQQVFSTGFPFDLSLLEETEELGFRKRKKILSNEYRRKAESAIRAIENKQRTVPDSYSYYCSIQPNFKFLQTDRESANYRVRIGWTDTLSITVEDIKDGQALQQIKINITPRDGFWALDVRQVELFVSTSDIMGFTVAWKAFDRELAKNNIKADIVQLNGYYHYLPRLICKCEAEESIK